MTEKSERKFETDDGLPWGWICGGVWRAIPKTPLLLGNFGPPPFDVELPDGRIRSILHEPAVITMDQSQSVVPDRLAAD